MPKYIVRVALGNEASDDYQKLNLLMQGIGFANLITSNDGRAYQLPAGEFIRIDVRSVTAVLDLVESFLITRFNDPAILVMDCEDIAWHLPRIE
jgi:hypothetical protein